MHTHILSSFANHQGLLCQLDPFQTADGLQLHYYPSEEESLFFFPFLLSLATSIKQTMSTTMVMTMATPTLTTEVTTCCPGCGFDLPPLDTTQAELLAAQARIVDLETQVRLLNQKATAAVDRWADYEDELTKLRAQQLPSTPPPQQQHPELPQASPSRTSFFGTNRLSALLSPRKSMSNLRPESAPHPSAARNNNNGFGSFSSTSSGAAANEDLVEALNREKNLRKEAEGRLTATNKEIEDLSATLFEQANEMVAEERRARAKLEQRVGELEKRDVEKRRRLEKLESAMHRIERVRNILAEGEDEKQSIPRQKRLMADQDDNSAPKSDDA